MTKTLGAYYQNCVLLYTSIWGVSNKPPSPLLGHWNNNSIPSHIKFIQFSMSWVFLDFFSYQTLWMGIGNNVTYIQTFEQHIVMLYSHFSANEWQILKGHSDKGRNNACYFFYLWIINSTSLSNNRLKTYITDFSGILQINKQMSSAYSINLYKKYTEIVISIQYNTDWT